MGRERTELRPNCSGEALRIKPVVIFRFIVFAYCDHLHLSGAHYHAFSPDHRLKIPSKSNKQY